MGSSRSAVEPLARALPADAQRAADLTPAGAVDAQVHDGTADLVVVPDDDSPCLVAHRGELGEGAESRLKRTHICERGLGTLR
ncbi:MAG: hypothetical protein J0I40_12675 [Cellulomonas sp.]|uniref:hypothetical protein n=1 Tax=Cellulomonas sp. 73-92 TaxID=1895740 RepID=UPI00092B7083|nr:hypothetical protein [Cellulomonas sp. 73-92]MBN9376216.1 hypothetical protein [Cellulomonas sp.]OJV78939.1 MAG: hypothetical protein BGO37_00860 [Cellulomonas sp. 73-92]